MGNGQLLAKYSAQLHFDKILKLQMSVIKLKISANCEGVNLI